ncbi:MAG: hypothetical protein AAGF98_19945 [Cyanobacteria bacterium P01_H01_bin.153]
MYPDSPYVLMTAGFLVAIATGAVFSNSLQQATRAWAEDSSTGSLEDIRGFSLLLPYLGICAGICVSLASGIQIFGFSAKFSYIVAAVMTSLTAGLVWRQLGVILSQLQQGGSKALDLDDF